MGKFGRRFTRRAILTSKFGNENFYKGYGARNEGTHTSKGGYVVRPERLLKIIAPDLTGFDLKPYVHKQARAPPQGSRVPSSATYLEAAAAAPKKPELS
jgi:large subunit ribosomal protein L41